MCLTHTSICFACQLHKLPLVFGSILFVDFFTFKPHFWWRTLYIQKHLAAWKLQYLWHKRCSWRSQQGHSGRQCTARLWWGLSTRCRQDTAYRRSDLRKTGTRHQGTVWVRPFHRWDTWSLQTTVKTAIWWFPFIKEHFCVCITHFVNKVYRTLWLQSSFLNADCKLCLTFFSFFFFSSFINNCSTYNKCKVAEKLGVHSTDTLISTLVFRAWHM